MKLLTEFTKKQQTTSSSNKYEHLLSDNTPHTTYGSIEQNQSINATDSKCKLCKLYEQYSNKQQQ